jgi:5-methylcytosine-specific restriction endonuclease McrA
VVNKSPKQHRAIGSQQWKKLRLVILARDGYVCYACGGEAKEVDHIWPRAKGGDTFDPLNCAAICRACNLAKGDRFFNPAPTPPVFRGNLSPRAASVIPENPFVTETTPAIN